jgi:hypothetical protein
MNFKILPCIAICVCLLAACKREPAPAAPAEARDDSAAHSAENIAADDSKRKGERMETGVPAVSARYTRSVDVQLEQAAFSSSGSEKDDTIGTLTSNFAPRDSVYVDVLTNGTDGDYQITTRWIDPAGNLLLENGRVVAAAGPQHTVFSLSKPDGWQPGAHAVEITINGKVAGKHAFHVK